MVCSVCLHRSLQSVRSTCVEWEARAASRSAGNSPRVRAGSAPREVTPGREISRHLTPASTASRVLTLVENFERGSTDPISAGTSR